MSNFIKKGNNEYKLRKDKQWTFKHMIEIMSKKPFEQVMKEQKVKNENKYELDEDRLIVIDQWKIKVPMKRKGKFKHVLVNEDEGELVD